MSDVKPIEEIIGWRRHAGMHSDHWHDADNLYHSHAEVDDLLSWLWQRVHSIEIESHEWDNDPSPTWSVDYYDQFVVHHAGDHERYRTLLEALTAAVREVAADE